MSKDELKEYKKRVDKYFEKINSSEESARNYLLSLEKSLENDKLNSWK